ncbi:asparaginase [Streptomyces sp. XD-27]|uniref:asparaginase n=1 Tax=Streptomyces sp. XD-27 TaxID=3062779 RepID=UPI0026F4184F|nr:asparaginase [Streptomyces sp. XD-27]WKX71608.1 asparaginase [Streptomyces sp. XD-27]
MSVALFTLGGTIAMAGVERGGQEAGGPVVARLTGADLTAGVPGLAELGTPLEVRDAHAVPGAGLTTEQVLTVVRDASRAVAEGATGVVVTQGTDTLEETAYLVDLVWPHEEPFVLTGAMRNPTLAGPDGPANLLAAARVAAAAEARGLGALVVFNDEIHAARWVRKTHSTSTATFASPNAGPIGHVIEGRVRVLVRPPRHEPLAVAPGLSAVADLPAKADVPVTPGLPVSPGLPAVAAVPPDASDASDASETPWPRVALYTVTLDDDGALLDGLAHTHAGLVVAGFGVGHVPSPLAPVLGGLAERIPVVLASRCGSGSVLRATYGAVGSEADLQRRGLINAGLLDPYKARILLRLLLANSAGRSAVAAAFARHG